MAASMATVPDPHIGFTNGDLLSHCVAYIVAAANASSIGAWPGIFLYPCLPKESPDVSINISAFSFFQNRLMTAPVSAEPVDGREPLFSRNLSTIASFTRRFANMLLLIVGLFTLLVMEK